MTIMCWVKSSLFTELNRIYKSCIDCKGFMLLRYPHPICLTGWLSSFRLFGVCSLYGCQDLHSDQHGFPGDITWLLAWKKIAISTVTKRLWSTNDYQTTSITIGMVTDSYQHSDQHGFPCTATGWAIGTDSYQHGLLACHTTLLPAILSSQRKTWVQAWLLVVIPIQEPPQISPVHFQGIPLQFISALLYPDFRLIKYWMTDGQRYWWQSIVP